MCVGGGGGGKGGGGVSAPFGFEGGMWNVIVLVLVPVHCLSF